MAIKETAYRMKERILQNLWHYQQMHHKGNRAKRWSFIMDPEHPHYSMFAQAIVSLQREGLVSMGENGLFYLTDKGYDYCERNNLTLSPEDRFFEEY